MSDQGSDEWLPSGWSVSVRVRRSGKKDKQYYSPSGLRFNSKLDVTRYLETVECSSPQPKEEKDMMSGESAKSSYYNTKEGKAKIQQRPADSCSLPAEEKKANIRESAETVLHNEVKRRSFDCDEKDNPSLEKVANCTSTQASEDRVATTEEEKSVAESAKNICGHTAGNGSVQSKEEINVSVEESEKTVCGYTEHSSALTSKEKKTRLKNSANVVVERAVAEGLPDGWIKEIKVKKKNNTVRRDSYYIDPVSGYVFRSMKDARRYLATGEIGRLAFKPKEDGSDVELEDDRGSSPTEMKKQRLEANETQGSEDKSSKQSSQVTDEQILDSVHTGEVVASPERTPDQGRSTDLGNSNLSEMKALEPSEKKSNCVGTDLIPDSGIGVPPDELSFGKAAEISEMKDEKSLERTAETSETKKTQHGTPKSRKKKSVDLPRRTSSRLAGVVVDPKVEVTRTRRTPIKRSEEEEGNRAKAAATANQVLTESDEKDNLALGPQKKRIRRGKTVSKEISDSCSPASPLEEITDKMGAHQTVDERKETASSLPQEEKPEARDESKEQLLLPFELPSGDILADPCIEFAIKTLTGVSFDTSKATPKSNSSKSTSADLPTFKPEEYMDFEKEVPKKQEPTSVLAKPAVPEKHTAKVNSSCEQKESEMATSSMNLPFGESWQDPCIEFAIKTLTGAIPVDFDLDIQDLMRQQMRSSQIQESTEVALSNVGMDNFCRTDLLWQHSDAIDKNVYRQETGTHPVTPQPLNVDLQRSGGAILRHQDRGSKYQR